MLAGLGYRFFHMTADGLIEHEAMQGDPSYFFKNYLLIPADALDSLPDGAIVLDPGRPRAMSTFDLDQFGDEPRIAVVVRDHMSGRALQRPRAPGDPQTVARGPDHAAHQQLLGADHRWRLPLLDRVLPLYTFSDTPGRFDKLKDLVRKATTWARMVGRGRSRHPPAPHRWHEPAGLRPHGAAGAGRLHPGQVQPPPGPRLRSRRILPWGLGNGTSSSWSRWRRARRLRHGARGQARRPAMGRGVPGRQGSRGLRAPHGRAPRITLGLQPVLPERWTETIDRILDEKGGTVVLTGVDRERPLADRIAGSLSGRRVVSAVGETTLGQYAALIDAGRRGAGHRRCTDPGVPGPRRAGRHHDGAGNPAWNGPVPGERMLMLQEWDKRQSSSRGVSGGGNGACNGPLCQSRLEDVTVTQVLESVEELVGAGRLAVDPASHGPRDKEDKWSIASRTASPGAVGTPPQAPTRPVRGRWLVLLIGAVVLAACSGGSVEGAPSSDPPGDAVAPTEPTAADEAETIDVEGSQAPEGGASTTGLSSDASSSTDQSTDQSAAASSTDPSTVDEGGTETLGSGDEASAGAGGSPAGIDWWGLLAGGRRTRRRWSATERRRPGRGPAQLRRRSEQHWGLGRHVPPDRPPVFRSGGANGRPSIEFTFAGDTLLQTNGGRPWGRPGRARSGRRRHPGLGRGDDRRELARCEVRRHRALVRPRVSEAAGRRRGRQTGSSVGSVAR